jgi:protein-tyrosine phosphatase
MARQAIDEEFGSLDEYLSGAGVTAADIEALRAALT